MTSSIDDVMIYASKFLGAPYLTWDYGDIKDGPPFYVDKPESAEYVKQHGVCCAGLMNLILHYVNKDVPGNGCYGGGTISWFDHFRDAGLLHDFDMSKNYEPGTLLIRRYRDTTDQGHLAMVYGSSEDTVGIPKWDPKQQQPLFNKLIHSCRGVGVSVCYVGLSHFCMEYGTYEYVVRPHDWLGIRY